MKRVRRGSYLALGWTTWQVGKRVVRKKAKRRLRKSALIGSGLLAVGVVVAVISNRNGA